MLRPSQIRDWENSAPDWCVVRGRWRTVMVWVRIPTNGQSSPILSAHLLLHGMWPLWEDWSVRPLTDFEVVSWATDNTKPFSN